MKKKIWTTCSRGHKFQKDAEHPVCPLCWPGYYGNKSKSGIPEKISAPALRALLNAKVEKLSDLRKFTEPQLLKLHGMGPKALTMLKSAMRKKKITFATE